MPIRFPKRRPDGSFELLVQFGGVATDSDSLGRWLTEWLERNGAWERVMHGAEREVQVFRFDTDFSADPIPEMLADGCVLIRFQVRPQAIWWKDWYAKFAEEFMGAHPGARLVKVKSR